MTDYPLGRCLSLPSGQNSLSNTSPLYYIPLNINRDLVVVYNLSNGVISNVLEWPLKLQFKVTVLFKDEFSKRCILYSTTADNSIT